jgi:dienelactone hydrolase
MSKLAESLRDLGHAVKAKRWAQALALGLAVTAAAVTGYCVGGDLADNAPENSAPADSENPAE